MTFHNHVVCNEKNKILYDFLHGKPLDLKQIVPDSNGALPFEDWLFGPAASEAAVALTRNERAISGT